MVDLLIKFVECSIRFESRGAILDSKNWIVGDVKCIESIEKHLREDGDKYYDDVKQGKGRNGHNLNPYILLAEMMKEERILLISYEKEIENLKGDSNNGNKDM